MYWIYNIPTWVLGLLCAGACCTFGAGGMLLTRGWVHRLHSKQRTQNDVVSFFFAAVSVFYGVTLGLITVAVWTNFSDAQGKVEREAQAIAGLYRTAEGFNGTQRTMLQGDIMNYTGNVIRVSWPQQRQGVAQLGQGFMLESMQKHILSFAPATISDQILETQMLSQFNELAEAKHARMNSAEAGMPAPIWALVIVGAMLTMAMTWCFDLESQSLHIWMIVFLGSLLGLIICLTAAMDNPFRGDLSVTADPYERIYAQMERTSQRLQAEAQRTHLQGQAVSFLAREK